MYCLQATAQLDLKRKELAAHLQKMGVGLGGLGKTLVTRTTDLFDQVSQRWWWHSTPCVVGHQSDGCASVTGGL